ncbi:MAG: hypothetical protein ACOCUV_00915 [bacterium]
MKRIFTIILLVILVSCKNHSANKTNRSTEKQLITTEIDSFVSLKFINEYVDLNNKMVGQSEIHEWIYRNSFLTDSFKKSYKKIIDNSDMEPLYSNPIFDAQDYPDQGFKIESFDKKNGYLILNGVNWPEFKIILKLVNNNDETLIDGCGIINIPESKRINR